MKCQITNVLLLCLFSLSISARSDQPTSEVSNEMQIHQTVYQKGMACYNGDGVARDTDQAYKLFLEGANSGDAKCAFMLALYHCPVKWDSPDQLTDVILSKNPQAAVYSRLRTYDRFMALYPQYYLQVAECVHEICGCGIEHPKAGILALERDYSISTEWMLKAAEGGDEQAIKWLTICGDGLAQETEFGCRIQKILEQHTSRFPAANYVIAKIHEQSNDYKNAFKYYTIGAEAQHARSCLELGLFFGDGNNAYNEVELGLRPSPDENNRFYKTGMPLPEDNQLAVKWLSAALELGCIEACDGLAVISRDVAKEKALAARLIVICEQKELRDDPSVGLLYSKLLLESLSPSEADKQKALRLLTQTADQGFPLAQLELGQLYNNGWYVDRNLNKAEHYLTQAKKSPYTNFGACQSLIVLSRRYLSQTENDIHAITNSVRIAKLAVQLITESPTVNISDVIERVLLRNLESGLLSTSEKKVWLQAYASELNSGIAQEELGGLYFEEDQYVDAIQWMEKAALQNRIHAQFLLGTMLMDKRHPDTYDHDKGITWLERSAFQGSIRAHHALGSEYYANSEYKKAFSYFKFAAEKGDPPSQYFLGFLFMKGKGVMEDFTQGLEWLNKAALQGDANAQYELSRSYYLGNVVNKDLIEAYAWGLVAGQNGGQDTVQIVLSKELPSSDRIAGQKRAQELLNKIESGERTN